MFDMEKLTSRDPNSILQGKPQAIDARFEPIKGDMEYVSKHKNTKASTVFKTVSKRSELWGQPLPQPDFLDNSKTDKAFWLPKAVKRIDSRVPGHLPITNDKRHRMPDGYSYDTLKRGFEATTVLKKPKALADMAKSPSRDNMMYQGVLDADYIRQVKKERR